MRTRRDGSIVRWHFQRFPTRSVPKLGSGVKRNRKEPLATAGERPELTAAIGLNPGAVIAVWHGLRLWEITIRTFLRSLFQRRRFSFEDHSSD